MEQDVVYLSIGKKPVSQNYSLAIFFPYLQDRVYLFELVMILLAKV